MRSTRDYSKRAKVEFTFVDARLREENKVPKGVNLKRFVLEIIAEIRQKLGAYKFCLCDNA